jgi:hypothetical protein
MGSDEFSKLAEIEVSANNYVHPTTAGNKHIPIGGAIGNFLKWSSDGTANWSNINWSDINSKPTNATATSDGFMPSGNFVKLQGIEENAINQNTADNRYVLKSGDTMGDLTMTSLDTTKLVIEADSDNSGESGNPTIELFQDGRLIGAKIGMTASGVADNGMYIQPNATNHASGKNELYHLSADGLVFSKFWHEGNFNPANKSDIGHIHDNASATGNGFFSSNDFNKLAGIAVSANNYVHPATHSLDMITETTAKKIMTDTERTKLANIQESANNYVHPVSHSLSMITETTSLKIMTDTERTKLSGIAQSANNYVHPTTAGNIHLPVGGASGNFVKWSSSGTGAWASIVWNDIGSKPSSFTPSAHTHSANEITDLFSNIYNKTEVGNLVGAKGDVHTSANNIMHLTNTFDNMGLAIKIQPSSLVADTTKLIQINKADSTEVFSVNYSGGVTINGDLRVTGVQTYAGTTTVDGDYTINGQLIVGGNATLGDASTDVTTVNGTLKIDGSLQEIGKYEEVHRRPLFGIAGDLQFQTDSIVFEDIVDYYGLDQYALPTVKSGATRYYRLYLVYSDDITGTQATAGQKATVRILNNSSVSKDLDISTSWGSANGRRDAFTGYFTDLPTGNGKLQAKLEQAGNNLGIRWVELVAYDKF